MKKREKPLNSDLTNKLFNQEPKPFPNLEATLNTPSMAASAAAGVAGLPGAVYLKETMGKGPGIIPLQDTMGNGDPKEKNLDSSEDFKVKGERLKVSGNEIKDIPSDFPSGKNDKVGFIHVSQSILDIIKNPHIKPPLTIGLFGKYGVGKSKIIEQIKTIIQSQKKLNIKKSKMAEKKNNEILSIIEFDVGKYQDSKQIWASLFVEFFKVYSKSYPKSGVFKYWWSQENKKRDIFIYFVGMLVSFLGGWWITRNISQRIQVEQSLLFILPAFPLLVFLYKNFWSHPLVKDSLIRFTSYPPTPRIVRDRSFLEDKIGQLFSAWAPEENQRILLIIDNLDRCNSKNVVDIIDELFALMNSKKIKEKLVAVVLADDHTLKNAIKLNDKKFVPENYFEKLFMLVIRVPSFDERMLRRFLSDVIDLPYNESNSSDGSADDLNTSDFELSQYEKQCFLSCLNKEKDKFTPRKIIRVIFAYRFIKYLWARMDNNKQFSSEIVIDNLVKISSKKEFNKGSVDQTIVKYLEMVRYD